MLRFRIPLTGVPIPIKASTVDDRLVAVLVRSGDDFNTRRDYRTDGFFENDHNSMIARKMRRFTNEKEILRGCRKVA